MWLGVASPPPLSLLDTGRCISSSCEPKPPTVHREPRVWVLEEDTELEKALGPQANENIEQELQAVSKSTRIRCSQGPAVPHIRQEQNERKQAQRILIEIFEARRVSQQGLKQSSTYPPGVSRTSRWSFLVAIDNGFDVVAGQ